MRTAIVTLFLPLVISVHAADTPPIVDQKGAMVPANTGEQVIVFKEPGRYGGWPANNGMWSWSDELVVGFDAAWFKDHDRAIEATIWNP